MSYQSERDETIAQLAREGWSTGAIRLILRAAGKAQRAAIDECNGAPEHIHADADRMGAWWDALTHRQASAIRAVHRACDEQPLLDCAIGGDPRGYVVKLRLKSGRSNDFGGETWGIPTRV